jgi:hypothetical protein
MKLKLNVSISSVNVLVKKTIQKVFIPMNKLKNRELFPILGNRTYIQLPEKKPYFILLCKTFRELKRLSLELKGVERLLWF